MGLVLVGTGHVLDVARAVQDLIRTERPTVVALELDSDRYRGLRQRAAGTPSAAPPPEAGRVYRYLARFQEDLGESFGVQPGSEMLAAAEAAEEVGAKIALIDLNAQRVVQDALKKMSLREKLRFAWTTLVAAWPRKRKGRVEDELKRYQQNPDAYLDELGRQFPTIRRAVIDDRDEHMSNQLRTIMKEGGHVLAVVGDGHVSGMAKRLADLGPVVHRLRELRSAVPRAGVRWRMDGTNAVGFSFDGQSLEASLRKD